MGKRVAGRSPMRLRRRTRRWLWALGVLLVAGAGVGYLTWNYGWAGVPNVGEPAPAFVLEDGDGRPVDFADYLGRRPLVLVFYMTYG